MQPSITLGIVTRNRYASLKRLLEAVTSSHQDTPDEIIIYDNSEVAATDMNFGEMDSVRYVKGTRRLVGGRNEILKLAETEIVAFLDDDTLPSDRYFRALRKDYKEDMHQAIGGVGGPAISVDSMGNAIVPIHGGIGYNKVYDSRGILLNQDHSPCWIPTLACEVDILRGANMSFRLDAIKSVGGFDESLEKKNAWWGEETDASLSVREAGYKILYDPQVSVKHFLDSAGGVRSWGYNSSKEAIHNNARNQIRVLRKHQLLGVSYLADWVWWSFLGKEANAMHGTVKSQKTVTPERAQVGAARLSQSHGYPLLSSVHYLSSGTQLITGWVFELIHAKSR